MVRIHSVLDPVRCSASRGSDVSVVWRQDLVLKGED